MNNPYPKTLVDEVSGVEVLDGKHQIWNEGYGTARKEIIEIIEENNASSEFMNWITIIKSEEWWQALKKGEMWH